MQNEVKLGDSIEEKSNSIKELKEMESELKENLDTNYEPIKTQTKSEPNQEDIPKNKESKLENLSDFFLNSTELNSKTSGLKDGNERKEKSENLSLVGVIKQISELSDRQSNIESQLENVQIKLLSIKKVFLQMT